MSVRVLLRKKPSSVITIQPDTDLATAARLLIRHRIGGLPVVAPDGAVVGFLAEREIVQAVDQTGGSVRDLPARRFMRSPAPTCSTDDSLQDVMSRMTRDRLRHIVVVQAGRIEGLISVGDLVKHRLDELETEAGVLRDYVTAQRALK
jgi:CBS domain-containing protein